jgi:hypothetical protein
MRRGLLAVSLACVFACAALGTALAIKPDEDYYSYSKVYFTNKTDAYVWVTAYEAKQTRRGWDAGSAAGAWCVPPGKDDYHGLHTRLYEVRVEVSNGTCQRPPVMFNGLRGYPAKDRLATWHYYVHGSKGHYTYNEIP